MDATVNDFLNEINQISSKNEEKPEVWQECFDELTGYSYFWNTETDEVTWVPPKSYKPAENGSKKGSFAKPNVEKEKKRPGLFVPPSTVTAPQYSSSSVKPEAKVKVYSIQDNVSPSEVATPQDSTARVKTEEKVKLYSRIYSIQDTIKKPEVRSVTPFSSSAVTRKFAKKAPLGKSEDSDDEKIELITEYGGESDSDAEEKPVPAVAEEKGNTLRTTVSPVRTLSSPVRTISSPVRNATIATKKPVPSRRGGSQSENDEEDDDDDDIDLLAKIQQRAQELKKLGGEVPPAVKNIIKNSDLEDKPQKPKAISGFSLVAGYNSDSSDSESDHQETLPPKSVFPMAPPPKPIPETSHSTLFPITKPIDVKDFIEPEPLPIEPVKEENNIVPINDFDSKAFQRKRRIGISLVNNAKRPKDDLDIPSTEFTGFGFKPESVKSADSNFKKDDTAGIYSGFQKGGVMFVKSDVLNPTLAPQVEKVDTQEISLHKKETENDYTVLREKLLFLGEGREPVLPVQVMLIQAEILFLAMNEGGLKLSYLHRWLKEMCSELIKLEKEAAPEGWLLQWDRSHKRYFYQNQVTGVSQWRYPEPDVTQCDDAMDICTTPPPQVLPGDIERPVDNNSVSPVMFGPQLPPEPPLPPSPPKISSPTPPPPPMISRDISLVPEGVIPDVPLPPEPSEPVIMQPPPPSLDYGQPLPPGVDLLPEVYNQAKEPDVQTPDTLITALDSFYSEIAEVSESTNPPPPPLFSQMSELPIEGAEDALHQQNTDILKKKKKKVKLAQGLTMKKKGVSQLVEKWKNVQKNYGD